MTPNVINRTALVEFCGVPVALSLVRRLKHRTVPPARWISWWCRGYRPLTPRRVVQAFLVEALGRERALAFCGQFRGLRFPSYRRVVVLGQRLMTAASLCCDEIEVRVRLESMVAPIVTADRRGAYRLVRRRLREAGRRRRPRGRALSLLRARATDTSLPSPRRPSPGPSVTFIRF